MSERARLTRSGFFLSSLIAAWVVGSLLCAVVYASVYPMLVLGESQLWNDGTLLFLLFLLPFVFLDSAVPLLLIGIAAGTLLDRMRPRSSAAVLGVAVAVALVASALLLLPLLQNPRWSVMTAGAIAAPVYGSLFGALVARRLRRAERSPTV